jgi:hypothetical protein
MLPQTDIPGSDAQPVEVQICWTTEHGALLRSDGRTRASHLDEIEARFGEYVLNEMMENDGKWIAVSTPLGVAITAHLNGRDYEIHVVPADEIASDFVVDTDEDLIVLPINATMFAVIQALNAAAQHEPPSARRIVSRPVQLDPAAWPRPAA